MATPKKPHHLLIVMKRPRIKAADAGRPLLYDGWGCADTTPLTDEQAELVAGCHALACKVALQNRARWAAYMDADEAISFAQEQLVLAARRFDPKHLAPRTGKPCKFSTFAVTCINAQFICAFLRQCGIVPIPSRHVAAGQKPPHIASLSGFFHRDGNAVVTPGCLAAPSSGPDGEAEESESRKMTKVLTTEVMARLTAREREVLSRRFGLPPHEFKQTLQEAGDSMGITKERVRQIQARVFERLRQDERLAERCSEVVE